MPQLQSFSPLRPAGHGCLAETSQGVVPNFNTLALVNTKVTDAELEHLPGLNQLRTLNLMGTLVSGTGWNTSTGCRNSKISCLDETKITDAGFEHLKGLIAASLRYSSAAPIARPKAEEAPPGFAKVYDYANERLARWADK